MMYLMDDAEALGDIAMMQNRNDGLLQMGCIAVAAALVIWIVSAVICVKVTAKRDYV